MKKTLIALMAFAGAACGFDAITLTFDETNLPESCTFKGGESGPTYVDSGLKGYGKAIVFNTSDYLSVTGTGYGSMYSSDFSVVTTVKFDAWGTEGNDPEMFIFGTGLANTSGGSTFTVRLKDGNLQMGTTRKGKNHDMVTVAGLATDTWLTLAMTYDADTREAVYYINGVEVGSSTVSTDVQTSDSSIGIGSGSSANKQGVWSGAMADFKLLNGTLSANEVAAYGSPMPIPEPTTATLSLLALAGLAARRRRK